MTNSRLLAPWSGLGQTLTQNASIETQAHEAGLDFEIIESPIAYRTPIAGQVGKYKMRKIDNKKALYRSDTDESLAVVGSNFKVVQPVEMLKLQHDLVDNYGFKMETAGTMHGGRKIWSLSKTGESTILKGNDKVDMYLLLASANDGTMQTTGMLTTIRMSCLNMLRVATVNAAEIVKVRHSTKFDPERMKVNLGLVHNDFAAMGNILEAMSNYKLTERETIDTLFNVLKPDDVKTIEDLSSRSQNTMKEVFSYAINSPGSNLESCNGTAWGLLNAITYYTDHKMNTRTDDARLFGTWFGNGAKIKDKAYNILAEKVGVEIQKQEVAYAEDVSTLFPNLNS